METSGQINFLEALLPLIGVVFVIAVGVVLLTQQFRKNLIRQKLEKEELKSRHQSELLRSIIETQEEERRRIALDMHDELGATLSITRMHLLQAEREFGETSAKLAHDLENIRKLTENSLASMRRISHELMPPQLKTFGLVKTLESFAEQINSAGSVSLTLTTEQFTQKHSWPVKLALYRVLLELTNNTIKHSGATGIKMNLKDTHNEISVNYSDNGSGFNAENKVGMGLKNIEGRITSLGGTVQFGNTPEGGISVTIYLPLAT